MPDEQEPRRLTRRQTLGLMGAAALVAAVVCGDDDDAASESSPTSTSQRSGTAAATTEAATTPPTTAAATEVPLACVITPAVTEGPYFVDERLNRSDLTSDPATGAVSAGVPLSIELTVSNVDAEGSCSPVSGAVVDMWHCDAEGTYSDVSGAGQSNTTGLKFLRGYQVTDANGRVQFTTIYPGWYMGRTVHIHFKVRTDPDSQQGTEFTSQLFFDEGVTDTVLAQRPYSDKGTPDTRNANDNIYDEALLLPVTASGGGYTGRFHVGVDAA